jgi:hypothetical protein
MEFGAIFPHETKFPVTGTKSLTAVTRISVWFSINMPSIWSNSAWFTDMEVQAENRKIQKPATTKFITDNF